MVKQVNSMRMRPLYYFFYGEVSSVIINNAIWNAMIVDKPFYESIDGNSDKSIGYKKGKAISRQCP